MTQPANPKRYDLEERTLKFGRKIIRLVRILPKNLVNNELSKQLTRSGTSVGANYREANETETKKDFLFRMRICRKEAKETIYWLQLIIESNPNLEVAASPLLIESVELVKIFAAIIEKSKGGSFEN